MIAQLLMHFYLTAHNIVSCTAVPNSLAFFLRHLNGASQSLNSDRAGKQLVSVITYIPASFFLHRAQEILIIFWTHTVLRAKDIGIYVLIVPYMYLCKVETTHIKQVGNRSFIFVHFFFFFPPFVLQSSRSCSKH